MSGRGRGHRVREPGVGHAQAIGRETNSRYRARVAGPIHRALEAQNQISDIGCRAEQEVSAPGSFRYRLQSATACSPPSLPPSLPPSSFSPRPLSLSPLSLSPPLPLSLSRSLSRFLALSLSFPLALSLSHTGLVPAPGRHCELGGGDGGSGHSGRPGTGGGPARRCGRR